MTIERAIQGHTSAPDCACAQCRYIQSGEQEADDLVLRYFGPRCGPLLPARRRGAGSWRSAGSCPRTLLLP